MTADHVLAAALTITAAACFAVLAAYLPGPCILAGLGLALGYATLLGWIATAPPRGRRRA